MNEQLQAIKARREAITPGNYFYREQCIYGGMVLVCVIPIRDNAAADATFIAHAPADIDTLLAEVEALTGELAQARANVKKPLAEVIMQRDAANMWCDEWKRRADAATAERDALAAELVQARAQLAQTTDERDEEWATNQLGL